MTVDKEKGYVVFTEEMKKTHTILVPNMLPMHFKICLLYTSRCV